MGDGGRLTKEQSRKFIETMIDQSGFCDRVVTRCMRCGYSWRNDRGRRWHRLTCWLRRRFR
jgi:hypothetical protein